MLPELRKIVFPNLNILLRLTGNDGVNCARLEALRQTNTLADPPDGVRQLCFPGEWLSFLYA